MTNKKLFEILDLVKGVNSNSWHDVRKIVNLMPSIKIKNKQWHEKFKRENPDLYPLDLTKIETWSTYGGCIDPPFSCIDLRFSNEKNKLVCDVVIYDGNNFTGYRKEVRFTAKLIMPNEFIKGLEGKLLYKLDVFAQQAHEAHLETQKNLWVSNFKNEILKK